MVGGFNREGTLSWGVRSCAQCFCQGDWAWGVVRVRDSTSPRIIDHKHQLNSHEERSLRGAAEATKPTHINESAQARATHKATANTNSNKKRQNRLENQRTTAEGFEPVTYGSLSTWSC